MVLAVGVSTVVAVLEDGWALVLVQAVVVGGFGAAFGATWEDAPERRRRTARAWAVRCAAAALLLTGLPHVIGGWSLLVLVVIGLVSPEVVAAGLGRLRKGRSPRPSAPAASRLPDEELARRWRTTSRGVRSTWLPVPERAALAAERQQLLDELERRDPVGFQEWLAREGWRERQER